MDTQTKQEMRDFFAKFCANQKNVEQKQSQATAFGKYDKFGRPVASDREFEEWCVGLCESAPQFVM